MEEAKRQKQREEAFRALTTRRSQRPTVTDEEIRAAHRARELGERTGTPVYVLRDGKIVDLTSERKQTTHADKEP